MTTPTRAILTVPATARAGDVVEVRTLIQHPMETGYRRGADGALLPRALIRRLVCDFDGALVLTAELQAAVAANPYLAFYVRVPHSGVVTVAWQGDNGFAHRESARITVA